MILMRFERSSASYLATAAAETLCGDHKKAKMEAREARSVVAIDGGGTTADEGFVLQKRQRTDEVKSER